ncbi:hypothetical protein JRX38_05995 [Gluconobacter cerinus]|uniref:hypothetical protein n=1 Tax=Gluconobacter cerinus TaxID=38307 RepID=UPI00193F3E53|nr:hypothetical protein [Gluconobacter cerinus]MBM3097573.1 hypothetical protein [Gluconobacter cerinus]
MGLPAKRIIRTDEEDVIARLAGHFGVTRDELIHVVKMAVGARRDSTADDPATAPGTLSYIFGTRATRIIFRAKQWERLRENGIESVFNKTSNIRIIFQNVDLAADLQYTPKAISKKRTASKELINGAQGDLFVPPSVDAFPSKEDPGEVWYLCVSCDELAGIRAELSRPAPLENEQFVDFHERIFIVKKGDLEDVQLDKDLDMPQQDYDIQISRK